MTSYIRKIFFKNKIARNSLFNLFGFIFPALLVFVFTPLLVRKMGTSNYGLWDFSTASLGLMGMFEFGLGTTLVKYIAEYVALKDARSLSGVLTTGFLLNLIISVFFVMPIYFLIPKFFPYLVPETTQNVELMVKAVRMSALGLIPLSIRSIGLAIPIGLQRYDISNALKITQNIVNLFTVLLIVNQNGSPFDAISGTIFVMCVFSVISIWVAKQMLAEYPITAVFSIKYVRKMFSFMTFTSITNIGISVFSSLDRIMVGLLLGVTELTYYSVLIGIANKFTQLSNSINQALMPASSAWKAGAKTEELRKYFYRASILTATINIVLGAFVLLIAEPFLQLWMGMEFAEHGVKTFRILILIYSVMSITATAFNFSNGLGFPWLNSFGTIMQGFGMVFFMKIWAPKYGLTGAAWANISSWIKYIAVIYIVCWLRLQKKNSLSVANDDGSIGA